MMRRFIALTAAALLVVVLVAPAASAGGADNNFGAHLRGRSEAPPADTTAQGQVLIKWHKGTLSYRLIVANIDDVVAAHIHCASEGVNGPIGVTLFVGGPTSPNGTLASGTIAGPDGGNACGWSDLDDVIDALVGGDTYVNVHTLGIPSGEIRGQVR